MYRRILLFTTLITLLLLCGCGFNPIKHTEYYPIEATIDSVYEKKVYLEYGNQFSEIDDVEFYNYCLSKIGKTIPATLVASFAVNHQVSYRIIPNEIYN